MIKMVIELTYNLNKGNDNHYTYLENGFVKTSVKNLSENTISVFEVFTQFKNNYGMKKFPQKCDVRIKPNEVCDLPHVNFTIGLWATDWSNFISVGVIFSELKNDAWSSLKTYVRKSSDYVLINNTSSQNKKIFISHSNSKRDKNIVSKLNNFLIKIGCSPYIAERDPQPSQHLWEKIRKELIECEKVIVLYTKDGIESGDIREEIGITVGLDRKDKIIAIVEDGFSPPGSILGQEYVKLNFKKNDDAVLTAANFIIVKKD
ncbi:MAG: toll/interleukin-1 receptor domain-containing protein [Nitrosotalea sp.]